MLSYPAVLAAATLTTLALAQQQSKFGQCGGENYSGPTACPTGWHCEPHNEFYSQCTTVDGAATTMLQTSVCNAATVTLLNTITSTMQPRPTSMEVDTIDTSKPETLSSSSVNKLSASEASTASSLLMVEKDVEVNGHHGGPRGFSTAKSSSAVAPKSTRATSSKTTTTYLSSSSSPTEYESSTIDETPLQSAVSASEYLTAPANTESAPAYTSQSPSSTSSSSPAPSGTAADMGPTYDASFTAYGEADEWNSTNCIFDGTCGYKTCQGYTVAVSEALFETGICGTCWRLTIETGADGSEKTEIDNAGNTIVAKVTNRCPRDGNANCAQATLEDENKMGMNVNFDTCMDSGATKELFGDGASIMGTGTVEQVDCVHWVGQCTPYEWAKDELPPDY